MFNTSTSEQNKDINYRVIIWQMYIQTVLGLKIYIQTVLGLKMYIQTVLGLKMYIQTVLGLKCIYRLY